MAHPARNAPPGNVLNPSRIFFATTKTAMNKGLLQSERNAGLLIEVFRSLVAEGHFTMHDFVIMPDHIHVLIEVGGDMTIEKAMQLLKGRFSYRLGKEFGFKGEIWQRGFTEEQVIGKDSFDEHRRYIAENPVKARLVRVGESFPFCYETLVKRKIAGAKAQELG